MLGDVPPPALLAQSVLSDARRPRADAVFRVPAPALVCGVPLCGHGPDSLQVSVPPLDVPWVTSPLCRMKPLVLLMGEAFEVGRVVVECVAVDVVHDPSVGDDAHLRFVDHAVQVDRAAIAPSVGSEVGPGAALWMLRVPSVRLALVDDFLESALMHTDTVSEYRSASNRTHPPSHHTGWSAVPVMLPAVVSSVATSRSAVSRHATTGLGPRRVITRSPRLMDSMGTSPSGVATIVPATKQW